MRLVSLGFAAALALAAPVRAQQPTAKPQNIMARVIRASLAGITLTDAEKTRLADTRATYAPKFKAVGDAMRPIRARMKAAREAKDTAAFRTARKDLRAQREQAVTILHATLSSVRASLAAEHQPTFDRNIVRVRRMIRQRFAP